MASSSCLILLITSSLLLTFSAASYFHAGGSDGWSSSKNVNYTLWAKSIHFQIDDVLVFEYDNKTENVIPVTPRNFKTCNLTAPVHKWTSGNDQVKLPRTGHFYFISSLDGKCEGRAKLSIQVYENGHDDDDKPTPATPDVPAPAVAPAPHPSSGSGEGSVFSMGLGLVMVLISFV